MVIKKNEETDIENFYEKNNKKYNIPKIALKALKDFGIFDARVLSVLTEAEIANIPNISEKTAVALVRAADDNFRGPLFQKAADQSERYLKKRKYFNTGSKNLNDLLGGGMPTSAIIEINGEYRTGKTQTCLTCSVTAQLPEEKGGLGRPVIYIDTENSFQATHLIEIGKRFGIAPEELLDNIFVVQAEQLRYLNQAIDRLPGYVQALDPGLIIIDSLMAPFRNEFHELNLLAVRQKKLGKLIGLLKRIAIAFNTSIIFTNQVMANIGPSGPYIPVIATGGHVVAHASDIRIFMKKLSGNQRRAKIDDCAWLPNETTDFFITPIGIADTESTGEAESSKVKTKKKTDDEEEEIPEEAFDEKEMIESESKEETSDEEELVESPLLDGINEVASQQRKSSKNQVEEEVLDENDLEISNADLKDLEEEMHAIDDEPKSKSPSKSKSKSSASSAKKSKITA